MSQSLRISLPGKDALSGSLPDDFAVYTDEDWVLIKEKSRGSGSLAYGSVGTVSHDLGYVPLTFVWGEDDSGNFLFQGEVNDFSAQNEWGVEIGTATVEITQLSYAGTLDYNYYIFYDKVA